MQHEMNQEDSERYDTIEEFNVDVREQDKVDRMNDKYDSFRLHTLRKYKQEMSLKKQ